jgi:hypothetical protein
MHVRRTLFAEQSSDKYDHMFIDSRILYHFIIGTERTDRHRTHLLVRWSHPPLNIFKIYILKFFIALRIVPHLIVEIIHPIEPK